MLARYEQTHQSRTEYHAFLKKLAMLPCPFLPAFLPFAELAGFGTTGLAFLGAGSSSENDSHTASSLVTGIS